MAAALAQQGALRAAADDFAEFTNDFAVEIDGDDNIADLVAGTHGCRIKREVRPSILKP